MSIPTNEESAGHHNILVKATTEYGAAIHFSVNLKLIEACITEKILFPEGHALVKTFTMREAHSDSDLKTDLFIKIQGDKQ